MDEKKILYENLKLQVAKISELADIGSRFSEILDAQHILPIILEKTRVLMNARFSTLKLLGKRRKKLTLASCAGIEKSLVSNISKCENDLSKRVLAQGVPSVITDIPRVFKRGVPHILKKEKIRSILVVPIFSFKRRVGVLSAYVRKAKRFQKEDVEMLEMVASICSMVIDNAQMLDRVKKDYLNTIKTLAKIIDANDKYTKGHCDKVMKYTLTICRRMKLEESQTGVIKTASLLHDIGKIGIDSSITNKPGRLTEEDWEKIRMHPGIGATIVSQVGFLNDIVPIIKHHHARFDGGGYPDPDRRGRAIPLGARIIAVADAYDAMTSDRPYRKAIPKEEAISELKRCSGSQFDPEIINAFINSNHKS